MDKRKYSREELIRMVGHHLKITEILTAAWPCKLCNGTREVNTPRDWMKGESDPCPRCWGEGWEIPATFEEVAE